MVDREFLEFTLDAITEAVVATDAALRLVGVNPAAEALLLTNLERVRSVLLFDCFSIQPAGVTTDFDFAQMLRGVAAGDVVILPQGSVLIRQDGSEIAVTGSISPIQIHVGNGDEQFAGVVFILHDATEKIRHDTHLLETRQMFQELFQSTGEAIILFDRTGTVFDANGACEELFHCARDRIIGRGSWDFLDFSAPDGSPEADTAQIYIDRALAGERVSFRWKSRRADGEIFPSEVTLSSMVVAGRQYVIAFVKDRSIEHRNEAMLRLQNDILEEIVCGVETEQVLASICCRAEEIVVAAVATVMRVDSTSRTISLTAGPSVSPELEAVLVSLPVGPGNGSCASAVSSGQAEFVSDTLEDVRWEQVRAVARQFGIKACWSMPVYSSTRAIVAAFALSHPTKRSPDEFDTALMNLGASLCGLVLQRDQHENAIVEGGRQFRSVVNALPDPVFVLNRGGEYVDVFIDDDDEHKLLYKKRHELLGRTVSEILPADVAKTIMTTIRATLETDEPQSVEYMLAVEAGDTWFEGRTATIEHVREGQCVMWVARDITQRKLAEQMVKHLAYHDPLTDLPNRTMAIERLTQSIAFALRHRVAGAILYIDLDDFKTVNDSLGHHAGDELLKIFSQRVSAAIRAEDILARVGGDEFIVVLPAIGDEKSFEHELYAQAISVAEKIRSVTAEKFEISTHEVFVATSIGISLFPLHGANVDVLIRRADLAMYAAKQAGRDRIRMYADEIDRRAQFQSKLIEELRRARRQGEFDTFFQPIVDLARKCIGCETLLRWHHPQRGLLRPEDFLNVLEDSRLILRVGGWVFERVADCIESWHEQDLLRHLPFVSVNISPVQFYANEFYQQLTCLSERLGDLAQCVVIEITEGIALTNIAQAIERVDQIHQLGFRTALDDFGIGQAALAQMGRLAVHFVKIDPAVTLNAGVDNRSTSIADAVIGVASDFGIGVIAEGVEKPSQFEWLSRHGVGAFQGYHFERPLSGKEFTKYLTSRAGGITH